MHSPVIDKTCTDLADMQLISKFNIGFRFLLCVIHIYSKYAWVIPLKNKKELQLLMLFKKILDESKRKPNKIWIYKGSEFYNGSIKSFLENSEIGMYSTHNEGKSAIPERFIRTLMNKTYKYMISVSKNMSIDGLADTDNKYNNAYHSTAKMKPVDVK